MPAERIEQEGRTVAEIVEVYKDKLLVIVFFAQWCRPCRWLLSATLPTVARQAGEEVVICPINIEKTENYFASRKHKVKDIPASLFFREGKEVSRIKGMAEPEAFIHQIRCHQKKKTNF